MRKFILFICILISLVSCKHKSTSNVYVENATIIRLESKQDFTNYIWHYDVTLLDSSNNKSYSGYISKEDFNYLKEKCGTNSLIDFNYKNNSINIVKNGK